MKKEDIYLDMSKLTKEQQDEIIGILPEEMFIPQYEINEEYFFLSYHRDTQNWWVYHADYNAGKTEITYEQFKELYPTWNK